MTNEQSQNNGGQEPAKPAQQPTPSTPSPLAAFLIWLASSVPKEIAEKELRVLSRGLFVCDGFVDEIILKFQTWHAAETKASSPKTLEKCRKHLFGDEDPPLVYLIEQKQSLVGFLIPATLERIENFKLPIYRGTPTDAKSLLHPKDPILSSTEGLTAELHPQKGLQMTLKVRGWDYVIPAQFLPSFAAILLTRKRLEEEFPLVKKALRYALPALRTVLFRARLAKGNKKVLIPASQRNVDGLKILRYKRLCLVVSPPNVLTKVYDLKGKSLSVFLNEELSLLQRDKYSKKIGWISLAKTPGPSVAFITLKKHPLKISRKAFMGFVDLFLRERSLPREFPTLYTLRDIIKFMSGELGSARWIPNRDIPKRIAQEIEPMATLLDSRLCLFVLSGDSIIDVKLHTSTKN